MCCWACAVPVVLQIHAHDAETHSHSLRSQPMGDSNFSDIEDEDSSDDSPFHFSAPAALSDGAAMLQAKTAATAAGRPCLSLEHIQTPLPSQDGRGRGASAGPTPTRTWRTTPTSMAKLRRCSHGAVLPSLPPIAPLRA